MINWLEVAIKLEKGETEVICPNCNKLNLIIIETKRPNEPKLDIYVNCPNCNENTVFSGVDEKKE
ncbi:MAG: ssDNA-binding Zn-finger/Zn-ribbon topoisomerase 1 [Crocinitomicaceae bacterium]|jgi:ssDNA-binding Zn-finger/Zn-ribbon topoisomerase 1